MTEHAPSDAAQRGGAVARHPFDRRRAGVLCHVTSLPAAAQRPAVADAERFLDFLAAAGIRVWQVLPLNPPDPFGSPYSSHSLDALTPALTSDLTDRAAVQYARTHASDFEAFQHAAGHWLRDYASYAVLADEHGPDWTAWPRPLRLRDPQALARHERLREGALDALRAHQFVAAQRWRAIRAAAHARDIVVLGDAPLYPALASADVWAARTLFELDADGRPAEVAGVPPDYFSAIGQRWGNPVYAWAAHAATDFAWWIARMRRQLALFDVVRIDHFRGLDAFWAIPAAADTAVAGHWRAARGRALLERLRTALGALPFVAEDLGVITASVDRLRDDFALPGMRVLQFAFSGDPANPHLPSNYVANTVAYTGTHDNDTTKGWYETLPTTARDAVDDLFGTTANPAHRAIEIVFASVARTAIAPLQDLLALGSSARMNVPGERDGNWQWRCPPDALTPTLARELRAVVATTERI
jgi:4-alpha-glucanotransferase